MINANLTRVSGGAAERLCGDLVKGDVSIFLCTARLLDPYGDSTLIAVREVLDEIGLKDYTLSRRNTDIALVLPEEDMSLFLLSHDIDVIRGRVEHRSFVSMIAASNLCQEIVLPSATTININNNLLTTGSDNENI